MDDLEAKNAYGGWWTLHGPGPEELNACHDYRSAWELCHKYAEKAFMAAHFDYKWYKVDA